MPVLANVLHEKLAQGVARGLTQKQAAIEAGYSEKGAEVTASKTLKRPEVKARVEELRAAADEGIKAAVAVDRQGVLEALRRNYDAAFAKKDITAANRAAELLGKELGMFIDRRMEVKSPLDGLNANQVAALIQVAGALAKRSPLAVAAPGAPALPPPERTIVLDGTVVTADPVLIGQGDIPDVGAE